jgi:hypothetical protein
MIRALLGAALIPLGVAWFPTISAAQEPTTPPPVQETGPPNHGQLYLGFTTNHGTDFTLGGRFSRMDRTRGLGLGAFADVIFAEDTEFLLGVTLQYHTRGRLMFEAGPGVAFNGGSDWFLRTGAAWEFGPVGLTVVPRVSLDFIHGGSTIGYGVAFGRRF